jgi:hypothetical protein
MLDPVALSIQQFVGAWHLLCTTAPGRSRASAPGVEFIFSGIPIPFFNVAVLTGRDLSASTLRQLGHDVHAWAAPTGQPYLLIHTQEALAPQVDPAAELAPAGFVPLMTLTGMAAGVTAPPAALPAGLQLSQPADDAGCAAALDVNSAAYGVPLDAAKPVLGAAAFWADKVLTLGHAAGQPVASTAVFPVDGYRYVALVATQPGEQRKGYADAVMRTALTQSVERFGDSPTVLHATDAGRPVYTRMGYARLASHTAFIESKFLGGH